MLLTYLITSLTLIAGILIFRKRWFITLATVLFMSVQCGFYVALLIHRVPYLTEYLVFDPLAIIFMGLLCVLSVTTMLHGFQNLKNDTTRRFRQYHAAFCGLVLSLNLALMANNITVVWVFAEATTLLVSVLIYHEKNKLTLEAVWKYIFVCSTGIAMAYMGILFLGLAMKGVPGFSHDFDRMAGLIAASNPLYLKIAFLFILIGYSTKMELFPMHTAGVDANSVAQPQVSAFISTAMVNLGFVAFFRIYRMMAGTEILPWMNHILIITGTLSVLVAAGYMLKARHTKRMLAYSTLEIMGLVAIGTGLGGAGLYAAILLLIVHSLTKAGLFYQLSQMFRLFHTYKLKEVGHYFDLNPAGSMVMVTGLAGILAIPPSGLFRPEYLIFNTLVISHHRVVFILVLLFLLFMLYAMATRMMHILFSPPVEGNITASPVKANLFEIGIQMVMILSAMMLCFYVPEFLSSLINEAIRMI